MKYKYIEIEDIRQKYKFHNGINIISNEENYVFDYLSIPLRLMTKHIDNTFNMNCDSLTLQGNFNVVLENNKQDVKLYIDSLTNNIIHNSYWMKENEINFNTLIDKEKPPIMIYYKRGGYLHLEHLNIIVNRKPVFNSYCNFPFYNYFEDYIQFTQMAIHKDFDEFSNFHFNFFKQIVDEFLSVNYFDNFHFSWRHGVLMFDNNGFPANINTETFDIGVTIGMLMRLYSECLKRKEKDFIGNPCDENGVVIFNYNFGERPSYSDKKWEYYNIFTKYFPNIQFIVC